VPERLGFLLEGHLRNAWLDPLGNVRDTLVFAAIPQEYVTLKNAWQATSDWTKAPDASGEGQLRVTFAR
jgi:hypothetical protein